MHYLHKNKDDGNSRRENNVAAFKKTVMGFNMRDYHSQMHGASHFHL